MASSACSPEIRALSTANNHLAFSLYKLLAREDPNVFFSPFSLSAAMAMLFCGAVDETAAEIGRAIGYDVARIGDDDLKTSFRRLLEELEKSPEGYTLAVANSMVSHKDFEVKGHYKTLLENSFKALHQEVDFARESEKAVNQINAWVGEKTNQMIPQLLDSLDPATVVVLLNAVYFKGFWVHTFDEKDTFLQYFYNKGDSEGYKQVDMMHIKKDFLFAEKDTFKALQLPYKGEDIAMLVLLPHERNGLENLEASLNSSFFEDLKKSMFTKKVETALPKFRLEYSKSLKEHFRNLGVSKAFSRGADFRNIADSDSLMVSDVVHKAVIEVNEEGSEAAAATAVVMMMCSLAFDPEFIVDHPFMFCIYNTKSDLILFMGKVNEL